MRLLKIKEVCSITALSRSTIYSSINNYKFPSPVKIGTRSVAWRSDDIDEWIASLTSASDASIASVSNGGEIR